MNRQFIKVNVINKEEETREHLIPVDSIHHFEQEIRQSDNVSFTAVWVSKGVSNQKTRYRLVESIDTIQMLLKGE